MVRRWHVAPSGATAPACHTQPPVATRKPRHGSCPLAVSWELHSTLETRPSGGSFWGRTEREKSSCQGDARQIGPSACFEV